MRKQRFMDQSIFICSVCQKRFPLMRNHGTQREKGHIKDLWCPFCKAKRKFIEIRHGDTFVDKDGKIIYM